MCASALKKTHLLVVAAGLGALLAQLALQPTRTQACTRHRLVLHVGLPQLLLASLDKGLRLRVRMRQAHG